MTFAPAQEEEAEEILGAIHDKEDVCHRCKQITDFTESMGLPRLSETLCKSAKDDYHAYLDHISDQKATKAAKNQLQVEVVTDEVEEDEAETEDNRDPSNICRVCNGNIK
eukprot:CAMPEP_0203794084 /NCGR_PEP_ID=MMETSP0100_2-20121128/6274_1 /ASSEMBLY_ACC=CAM_ASM_000210 /TAXON_ID=96639 /ORGANISM=" , Strain NY0313808BC1" /LENGTH=109 /DNA_ID=CAMNT_0050698035 /DNA_START=53 /DNA_END=382 /DNA_ORIENTATION=+